MKPKRVQRKRTKGYKLPRGSIYVGRPTVYANPYKIDKALPIFMRHKAAVDLFRSYAKYRLEVEPGWLEPLRGKDLACWCALEDKEGNPVPCHVDVLIELANREREEG